MHVRLFALAKEILDPHRSCTCAGQEKATRAARTACNFWRLESMEIDANCSQRNPHGYGNLWDTHAVILQTSGLLDAS
jgi:hypothetical protein